VIDDPRLHFHACLIRAVHDGDTFNLVDTDLDFDVLMQGRSLRLLGVGAPELGTVREPNPDGELATGLLLDLLGRDRFATDRTRGYFGEFGNYLALPGREPQLILRTTWQRGGMEKYGRLIATAWLPGVFAPEASLNAQMRQQLDRLGITGGRDL
jgi:hypothetical protein